MKLFRKLRAFALLFAVLVLVIGFTVLNAPKKADASRCECWVMYCTVDEPAFCWCVCEPCPPILPPGPEDP